MINIWPIAIVRHDQYVWLLSRNDESGMLIQLVCIRTTSAMPSLHWIHLLVLENPLPSWLPRMKELQPQLTAPPGRFKRKALQTVDPFGYPEHFRIWLGWDRRCLVWVCICLCEIVIVFRLAFRDTYYFFLMIWHCEEYRRLMNYVPSRLGTAMLIAGG